MIELTYGKSFEVDIVNGCLFLINVNGVGQSVESLEKKINTIQKDIKLAEKLLKETSKNKEVTLEQVNLLQTQISQRESLIRNYQSQINVINKEIQDNKKTISNLERELLSYRKEYADMLLISYRNRNNINSMLFIFSSDDFNQAVRRMRYIKELNSLVKDKIEEIDSTQIKISIKIENNERKKKEKEKILADEKKERESLLKDRDKLNKDIASLKKKEKQIQKDLANKEKQTKDIKKQIENIIAEEVRKAKEREAAAKKNNSTSIDYQLSGSFAQNKGKLPYPVQQGIITRKYGLSPHPTLKKVTTNNNGVDITTVEGAKARAVFDGEVCFVRVQGNSNAILVRHGLYFTLYANLDKIYVKNGDKVSIGDELGRVHTNADDNKTILHFEIWQENKTSLNPALWIKK